MTREEAIEIIKQDIPCEHDTDLIEALEMAIKALKLIPDNAINGDVIKALFPDFEYVEREYLVIVKDRYYQKEFSMEWWNAPYKAESGG